MSHEGNDPVFESQACFMGVGRVWVIMGGLKEGEVFFGGLTCFQVRTGRSGKINRKIGVLSVGGSFVLSWNMGNAWRVWVFGIGGLEKMNSPSREGRGVLGLCREDLSFGFALVVMSTKGGWVVDQDWGTVGVSGSVCYLVVIRNPERLFSIQIKIRMFLLIGKEETFESVHESIQAHTKGNKKEFGEALVMFRGEFTTAFVESKSDLFKSRNRITFAIYTFDVSVFENTYLTKRRDLGSVLFFEVIVFFHIFHSFWKSRVLFRRDGFLVLSKIVKTLKEKDDVIENIRWSTVLLCSCDKGFAGGKGRSRKIMGSTIVFDVLLQTIKELPMLFRNRGSERFNRGELGGEGFGRHRTIILSQKSWIRIGLVRKECFHQAVVVKQNVR
jgi:hypothetical protein